MPLMKFELRNQKTEKNYCIAKHTSTLNTSSLVKLNRNIVALQRIRTL